jgi:hypothetical protein
MDINMGSIDREDVIDAFFNNNNLLLLFHDARRITQGANQLAKN